MLSMALNGDKITERVPDGETRAKLKSEICSDSI